jgi:branched-chain amino acid transport system ATP-binding protein
MAALLEVHDLSKSFGGIGAVNGVSFAVHEGEILGLIGPNGSGKSTLFNCILGQLTPSAGEVRVDGRPITGMRSCDLNRLGISRTFQLLQVFPELTVRENLVLAGQEHQGSMWSRLIGPRDAGLSAAAGRMLDFFRLAALAEERAGGLSYGQQKLLDVAMAFMAGPRLVLLDEPAAGLDTDESRELGRRLRAMPEQGVTVLLVDHDMGLVLSVCDHVHVLDFGRVIARGTPAEIRENPAVIAAYLGGGHHAEAQVAG